jgi:uncharacterized membrane protein
MNGIELSHLLFRWLHVLSAVMAVGQVWSLTFVNGLRLGQHLDPGVAAAALRAHNWLRWSAGVMFITGIALLVIVYYSGGALTSVGQSPRLALAVGIAALFAGWGVYDAIWRVLIRHQGAAALVSLALVTGFAAGLHRVMTGRAMFIHMGAMLGIIVANNVQQRIWPVESRRLSANTAAAPPSAALVEVAALRLKHNASLSVAAILFMVSNHFPLLYGQSLCWLFPPGIEVIGWLATRETLSR